MSRLETNFIVATFTAVVIAATGVHPSIAEPPKDNALMILPGEGLKGCKIGGSIKDAHALFGKPSSEKDKYVNFDDHGVVAFVEEGKIDTLFFYFKSRTRKQFMGTTDKGIGKDSSIEDVIKNYGKPDRIGESVVSRFGEEPGAVDNSLFYSKLGVHFTFYDKKLAFIVVNAKKSNLESRSGNLNQRLT